MNRQQHSDGLTGGLLLIGLGVLSLTGWWWPGIMVVVGIAVVTGKLYRGEYADAVVPAAIFFGIPLLTIANVPWQVIGPLALVGLGTFLLARNMLFGQRTL